jgi:hypothetical protein
VYLPCATPLGALSALDPDPADCALLFAAIVDDLLAGAGSTSLEFLQFLTGGLTEDHECTQLAWVQRLASARRRMASKRALTITLSVSSRRSSASK